MSKYKYKYNYRGTLGDEISFTLILFYWTSSELGVITPCGTSVVVSLRPVVGKCGFLAPRVGLYRHQCVGSSGGGVVSVPWF
jgi:hypothetical protein